MLLTIVPIDWIVVSRKGMLDVCGTLKIVLPLSVEMSIAAPGATKVGIAEYFAI
jgi:hypothetical protein